MTKKQDLSARLRAVADMVTAGNKVCDVGCDHGYIPIYLVQNRISPAVLAMDINKGPLERAKAHVLEACLAEYITLRLSDGLKKYQRGEAETLICAGMGGPLMQKILSYEPEKSKEFQELILQPQSEISDFRKFLRTSGYLIVDENMIFEDGKFYPMMRVVPKENGFFQQPQSDTRKKNAYMQELEDDFGPILLEKRNSVLIKFLKLEWQKTRLLIEQIEQSKQTFKVQIRLRELETILKKLQDADRLYKMGGIQ